MVALDEDDWANGRKKPAVPCEATEHESSIARGGKRRPVGPLNATQCKPPDQYEQCKETYQTKGRSIYSSLTTPGEEQILHR